jgi:1-acyl-sn-glycerol-3-phosphate acyltransferase
MKHGMRKLRIAMHLLHGMLSIVRRFPGADDELRQKLIRAWSMQLLRLCGVTLVVHRGDSAIERGALVVSNHVSWIDIFVIDAWRPTPFVSKAEIRQWPVVGWLATQIGTVFIQREKRSDARRIVEQLGERLAAGELVCVFPEGTTSDGLGILPFHANLFQAAVATGAAVQPICLLYEDAQGRQTTAAAYWGDMSMATSLQAILDGPLTAHLYVGAPLPPGLGRRQLADAARADIGAALRVLQGVTQSEVEAAPAAEADLVSG